MGAIGCAIAKLGAEGQKFMTKPSQLLPGAGLAAAPIDAAVSHIPAIDTSWSAISLILWNRHDKRARILLSARCHPEDVAPLPEK